ncbi:universal stress protein [Alkalihalobacillus macyae]|uniref:universal stress protein n=1 Tax=Guptibacillus hwajinpoensis TaxID=208199 RepID=UPI00273BA934|nr:universal stress protein [Alkalihalobacillus macyae]MDP4551861.1 universal stress protein [Alkalihalobacillus macyae]
MMYSKIVVAYDRSEDSEKALQQAVKLAELNHASIHLVHVSKESNKFTTQPETRIPYGTGSIGNEGHAGVPSPVQESGSDGVLIEKSKGEALLREVKETLYHMGVNVQSDVRVGDPAKEIVDHAVMTEADLIVIGSRGLSGMKKWMLGSVSQKVAQQSPCPVLIVK